MGDGVVWARPGMAVSGLLQGGFAQYALTPERMVAPVPRGVDVGVALGEPLACVVGGMARTPIWPGSNVAVVGVGFMGLLSLQATLLRAPARLIATRGGADHPPLPAGRGGRGVRGTAREAGGFHQGDGDAVIGRRGAALVVVALLAAAGCGGDGGEVELSRAALISGMEREGFTCAATSLPDRTHSDRCTGPAGDASRVTTIATSSDGTVQQLTAMATVTADIAAARQAAAEFMARAASSPYHGPQAAAAARWTTTALATATLDGLRLSLTVSRDARVLTLTVQAPSAPTAACPCHAA